MNTDIENQLIRCPRLGHEITLSYCLQESIDLPCDRIIRCWSFAFDVAALLQNRLSREQWLKFINIQPKEKLASIVELIEAAKSKK
ncbi:MAG: hypothetical protein ABFD50_07775 [Smithella sp.]